MNAQSIVERIAPNEAALLDSLFNPVFFSDGSKGTYNGYIVKRFKNHVRFTWGANKNLMVNSAGVLGTWDRHEGKTYYSYILDPFGSDVGYRAECEAAALIYRMGV